MQIPTGTQDPSRRWPDDSATYLLLSIVTWKSLGGQGAAGLGLEMKPLIVVNPPAGSHAPVSCTTTLLPVRLH